jgi:sarcosine reductase
MPVLGVPSTPVPERSRYVHVVRDVAMGDRTSFEGGRLTLGAAEAEVLLAEKAPALASVRLTWASPGDPVRLVKVLDAVEPRTKGAGGAGIFPGFVSPTRPGTGQDEGALHVLRGAAVVAAGFLPRAQEGVVDMSGPAAELSPLGSTHNLVVEFTPAPGAAWEDVDNGLRRGLLALAARLAEAALDSEPDAVEPIVTTGDVGADGRPRVGTITNLQTQGTFKDVFVHGRSLSGGMPVLVGAEELDDGAVVSGQFGHPALKNPTWVFQNHPVVAALGARHGQDLSFGGVVLSPEPVELAVKKQVSLQAAEVCREAGFDAVIVTKEGGGNADADMALKMDALEDMGIRAVGLFAEMAGPDGTGPPIVVPPERATAMISTGNYDTRLQLPEMERALGGEQLALLKVPATSAVELPTAVVYCALSPLGWGRLTCAEVAR